MSSDSEDCARVNVFVLTAVNVAHCIWYHITCRRTYHCVSSWLSIQFSTQRLRLKVFEFSCIWLVLQEVITGSHSLNLRVPCYLHQGRYMIGVVCPSVCHSVNRITAKSNDSILLKRDAMIGSTSRKNWLTFGGDPIQETDARSLFHFPHHCWVADFRRFISISHIVTSQFLWYLAKWLTPTREWIYYIFGAIQQKLDSD